MASEFELWLDHVNDYIAICKVKEPAEKKSLFLNLAGLSLRRIVKGLVVDIPTGDGADEYKALTDAIRAYFRPAVNTTAERHKFRQMRQQDHESVTAFMGRLRTKVELCDFASTSVDTVINGQLRDQLIAGITNNEIQRELLKYSKLTLADAVAKAVALETSFADSSLYEGSQTGSSESPLPNTVNKVSVPSRGKLLKCKSCGRLHQRGKQHCPAADSQCSHCHKMGHYAAVCLQKKRTPVAQVVDHDTADSSEEPLHHVYDSVYVVSSPKAGLFTATLKVNGTDCKGLLDTGATRTLITEDIVTPTRPSSVVLKAYDGNTVTTLGVADVTITAGDKSSNAHAL